MNKLLLIFLFILYSGLAKAQTYDSCTEAETNLVTGPGTFSIGLIDGDGITESCAPGTIPNNTMAEWLAYEIGETTEVEVTITANIPQNATNQDTRLHVYRGDCMNLVCVDGNDDVGGGIFLSEVSFIGFPGETYFIAWDNRYPSGVNFDFEIIEEPAPPLFFSKETLITQGRRRGVVDMNGDFLDDILTIKEANDAADGLYVYEQQNDGSFVEKTYSFAQTYTANWGLSAGDYDRNGYNDICFGSPDGVAVVKADNNGTGYSLAYSNDNVFVQRNNFVDINNDGNLDIFICHDILPNVYYINDGTNLNFYVGAEYDNGTGTCENPTPPSFVDDTGVPGGLGIWYDGGDYGSIWVDYDNDNDMDMFISKCGGCDERSTDQLFRNNGDGTFTEVAAAAGLADPMQTWSAAWGDYDNDGDMDAFVGSFSNNDLHKIVENNGDGTFTNITSNTVLNQDPNNDGFTFKEREHMAFDFNNDGYIDILSNGFILLNDGDFTFTHYDLDLPEFNMVGDLNNDGYLDLKDPISSEINYNASQFTGNNWLKINTIGDQSNKNGIGARIEITSPTIGTQIREVRSGEGFYYMHSLNTHFGLGQDTTITSLTVYWPSGVIDVFTNLSVNQTKTITEGETLSLNDTITSDLKIYPNPTIDNTLYFEYSGSLDNAIYSVFDINGRRVLNAKLESSEINVSGLSSGSYILRLASGNNIASQKFIKR